jgi:CRISPR-associated protein Cas5d
MPDNPTASSPLFRLKVWGEFACFTRPEMKVERVSYDVMTPSAARGVLEAILWKPEIRWRVARIDVLKPVRFESVRRNEVSEKGSLRNAITVMNGGSASLGLVVEDVRQQRAGMVLRDVAYTIHARLEFAERAPPGEVLAKYHDMFARRAVKGQCFQQPYLGCREFPADFALIPDGAPDPKPDPEVSALGPDLGWMFFDFDYAQKPPKPTFFRARIEHGRVPVPEALGQEVRA